MIMASKFYILHYHHVDTERKFKILSFVFQEIRISMAEMQELNFKDAFGCDTSCEAGTGKSDFRSMENICSNMHAEFYMLVPKLQATTFS